MFDSIKNLFKGGKAESNTLVSFSHKDHYFYRCATWAWMSEKLIQINYPHVPWLITLDEWPQFYNLAMLQWYNAAILQCYNATMLQWCNATMVQCYNVRFCNAAMLQLVRMA